jgi:hypothetical protein
VPMVEKSGTEGHPSAPRYGVKSGSQKHGLGVVAGAGGSGLTARRIPASAQGNAKAPTPTGAGVVSGLKAPARYAAGGTTLPRPVSRLPAPSGPGRVKMIGLTVGGGNGGGLVRRAGGHGL